MTTVIPDLVRILVEDQLKEIDADLAETNSQLGQYRAVIRELETRISNKLKHRAELMEYLGTGKEE